MKPDNYTQYSSIGKHIMRSKQYLFHLKGKPYFNGEIYAIHQLNLFHWESKEWNSMELKLEN